MRETGNSYLELTYKQLKEEGLCKEVDGMAFFLPTTIAEPGQPFALTKGADSFVLPLCKDDQMTIEFTTQLNNNIQKFSEQGFRTLVFGSKALHNSDTWCSEWGRIS